MRLNVCYFKLRCYLVHWQQVMQAPVAVVFLRNNSIQFLAVGQLRAVVTSQHVAGGTTLIGYLARLF